MKLTAERLRSLLHYEEETGAFTWVAKSSPKSNVKVGALAGCQNSFGHLQIKIDGKSYLTSRLAYLYKTGSWPPDLMDHEDRNPSNDRWKNIRPATYAENNRNRPMAANKTSVHRGVSKRGNRWQVVIRIGGKTRHIGSYQTEDAAGSIAAPYFAEVAP